jgi:hypothetical protein
MSNYLAASGILALSAFTLVTATVSRAEDLKKLAALCESNPSCTHEAPSINGAVSFRIQRGSMIVLISCSAGSPCVRRHPRGQYAAVDNTTAPLSPR